MPLSQLGQIALPVSDADRSEAFYAQSIGLPKLFRFGNLVFFDCAGVRLILEGTPKAMTASEGVCHYFRAEGIEATLDELGAKGCTSWMNHT